MTASADEAHFTPQMTLRHYTTRHGISIEDIGVAPIVVISWGRSVIEELANAIGAGPAAHWLYNDRNLLYTGQVEEQPVCFLQAPVGAPGTILMMEEMIACGARTFIGLGWAGSLQPSAPIGAMLIPTQCIREEGTSFHYIGAKEKAEPNPGLAALLLGEAQAASHLAFSGPHWTTDAPYRELVSKIEAYRERGVLGVDMETSAMYALGSFRGVRVCNLLVVSDELWREWNPAFGTQELIAATQLAAQVVLSCLRKHSLRLRRLEVD